MRFADIKDHHHQRREQTGLAQSDFQAYWRDANGENFADGVLGGLAKNLDRLGEDAAAAAVRQQENELFRNETEQYISAAKMRDEAQDAKNQEFNADCDALEKEIDTLNEQWVQLDSERNSVRQALDDISHDISRGRNSGYEL